MTPITLLTSELNKFKKALKKSTVSYIDGDLSIEQHQTHKKNLNRLINEYSNAIEKLNK